jgi:hypothetical protein
MGNTGFFTTLFLWSLPVLVPIAFALVLTSLPFAVGALIALVSALVRTVWRFLPGAGLEPNAGHPASAEYPDQTSLDPWERLAALDPELSRQS